MKNKIKISIITVCLNSEKTIESTIQSVVNQTCDNIEYIIIDGVSKDNTLNIIQKYSNKISLVISEKDRGIYDAMNKGIKNSSGEIIYFLNSGDYFFDKTIVEKVMNKFDENIDLIYGDIIRYKCNGNKKYISYKFSNVFDFLMNGICHQAIFSRRRVFLHNSLFNTHYPKYADYDWLLNLIVNYNIDMGYVEFPISFYLEGGFSSSKGRCEHISVLLKHVKPKYFLQKAIIHPISGIKFLIRFCLLLRYCIFEKIKNS